MSKKLIAFYSRADENYVNGTVKMLRVGNTQVAADIIKKLTDADVFKIEAVKPYSENYQNCIKEAKIDLQNNARPELKKYPDSIQDYDVIYLGFPNYWSTMPMAVFTFLEHFDFSGKTIYPFCTETMICDFKACGGVLLIATGFRMMKVKEFPIADMIPAMVLVMPLSHIWITYVLPFVS